MSYKWKYEDTQWAKDMEKNIVINGNDVQLGFYNLVITCATLKLWNEKGLKATANFKLKDIRTYFGLDGSKFNKHQILDQLIEWRRQLETPNENTKK